jgi:tRNA threonylcarbamoyladenosine biosynthesis protein TsaB
MVTHPDMRPVTTAPAAGPLLALDTSGTTARVALLSSDGVRLGGGERTGERHSAYLLPLCQSILADAGVRVAELGGIACGRGPGSFTGLRVGLAVAKGLALPFDLPLHLVSSLEALATDLAEASDPPPALLVPVIDAGKGEVYVQVFSAAPGASGAVLQTIEAEGRLTPAALLDRLQAMPAAAGCLLGGTGVDRHAAAFQAALGDRARAGFPGPTAEAIGRLARTRISAGLRDDLSAAVPSYGRAPDITRPRPRGSGNA